MYSKCISCGAELGSNAALEQFPVGKRLAFDPIKGRLWVLCFTCRSWNLAPLEERWEAVESAERLFENATIGASTENVALGRLRGGTQLLRVGAVDRPELAYWRYGDQLLGRWRKHRRNFWLYIGAGAAIGALPVLGSVSAWSIMAMGVSVTLLRDRRHVMRTTTGRFLRFSDASRALLLPADTAEGWRLEIPQWGGDPLTLEGDEGLRALRVLLPRINWQGGRPEQVRNAVDEVERLGSPVHVLRESAVELQHMENVDRRYWGARPHRISTGHRVIQLALEMAANEERERRALEGELRLLEREWQEAEELAAISDDLLFPRSLREQIRRWKEKEREP